MKDFEIAKIILKTEKVGGITLLIYVIKTAWASRYSMGKGTLLPK